MPLYDPRLLSSSESFEILVFLVLQQENPSANLTRVLPPDWGIDILSETGKSVTAYQCKHHSKPRLDLIKQEVRNSLARACASRDSIRWRKIIFCFSGDLSAPQHEAVRDVAREFGLKRTEFRVRSGTSFLSTLAGDIPKYGKSRQPLPSSTSARTANRGRYRSRTAG